MKFKVIAAALLAIAGTASALADGYNRVQLSYELEPLIPSAGENTNLNGFGISYVHGFGLTPSIPLYLEVGAKLGTGFWSKSENNVTNKLSLTYIDVPVSVTYKWNIGYGITVAPYAGINAKLNVVANSKYSANMGGTTVSETVNLLKGDDGANVFQIGWQLGAGVYWKMLYLGLGGGTDFNEFAPSINSSNFNITAGFCF